MIYSINYKKLDEYLKSQDFHRLIGQISQLQPDQIEQAAIGFNHSLQDNHFNEPVNQDMNHAIKAALCGLICLYIATFLLGLENSDTIMPVIIGVIGVGFMFLGGALYCRSSNENKPDTQNDINDQREKILTLLVNIDHEQNGLPQDEIQSLIKNDLDADSLKKVKIGILQYALELTDKDDNTDLYSRCILALAYVNKGEKVPQDILKADDVLAKTSKAVFNVTKK